MCKTGLERNNPLLRCYLFHQHPFSLFFFFFNYVRNLVYEVLFAGKNWLQGKLYVGRHAAPFKVIFEAERSYNVFGDIAIDDVSFVNCTLPPVVSSCQRGQHRCARGSCIDPGRLCDFTDDCGDSSDETNCYNYQFR